jgi:HAD superfamily hydrolase (TIGR01509 family)
MTPKAVIFDCNGVLVDSEVIAFDLFTTDLRAHGLTTPRPAMEEALIGLTLAGVAAKARTLGADLPEDWVKDFYARLYARLEQGAPLVAGVLGVLDALDAAGIPYAIGSNGSPRKMQITLGQHAGLLARFGGRVFSGQDMPRPKPFPDVFLHAARSMGADPATCVVIEDSPTGARAAKAAGMRCMGYAPHGSAGLVAEGAEPFGSMADLPRLLGLT